MSSSTASFYIFKKSDLAGYIKASRAPIKSRAIAKHPLTIFRKENLALLPRYQWTGTVFPYELNEFLKKRSVDWGEFIAKKASADLCDPEWPGGVELFAGAKAKELCSILDSILEEPKLERQIINFFKKYPKGEPRTSDRLPARAIFDAMLIFRYWLSRIPPKHYGELFVSF